jgi:iron uptake system component EfeO
MTPSTKRGLGLLAGLLLNACGPAEQRALDAVQADLRRHAHHLSTSSAALCAAAPTHGWSATGDAAALATMRAQWAQARNAWESAEGAVAPLFPDLDEALDGRFEGAVEQQPDGDLFDARGFTGLHAVERVLFADAVPAAATRFEQTLGAAWIAPAFPADDAQAAAFRAGLCAQLVADAASLEAQVGPLQLDTATAFRAVIGAVEEQLEKTTDAARGAEESRYARTTLDDLRANLAAARAGFDAFRPWLEQLHQAALAARVEAGFVRLAAAYDAVPGAALPEAPAGWSSAERSSAFGGLYGVVADETDLKREGSLVFDLAQARAALGVATPAGL